MLSILILNSKTGTGSVLPRPGWHRPNLHIYEQARFYILPISGRGGWKQNNQPFVNRFYIESKLHTDLRTELIKVFSRDVSDQHVTRFVFVCLFNFAYFRIYNYVFWRSVNTTFAHFSGWSPWWWRPKELLLQFPPQPWLPCANTCIRWAWCCWCVRSWGHHGNHVHFILLTISWSQLNPEYISVEPKLFSSYLPNVLPQVVACLYACRFYASYLQYSAPEETNICFFSRWLRRIWLLKWKPTDCFRQHSEPRFARFKIY